MLKIPKYIVERKLSTNPWYYWSVSLSELGDVKNISIYILIFFPLVMSSVEIPYLVFTVGSKESINEPDRLLSSMIWTMWRLGSYWFAFTMVIILNSRWPPIIEDDVTVYNVPVAVTEMSI
jgi:hypothetical protein